MLTTPRSRTLVAMAALLFTAQGSVGSQPSLQPELSYRLDEGQNINAFVRNGPVAAHVLLRHGTDPRFLAAFPAGNSGVGLWFEPLPHPARWQIEQGPLPVSQADAGRRPLHGVSIVASFDAKGLTPKQAVLSNVRFLRDYQSIGKFPAEVAAVPHSEGRKLSWTRNRADGAPGYLLEVEVLSGTLANGAIGAPADGPIRLRITALSGDTPLTGLGEAELLKANAANDPAARKALAFLSYREKFLAGSWRFNTYFGRDTLMSARLLMPVLQPAATEAALQSVLARLNQNGEVAHEEGLSEFAILDRKAHGLPGNDRATLDYAMVDDDFMLAPVVGEFLLNHVDPAEARAFLARSVHSETGEAQLAAGQLLVRNLRFVTQQAAAFAARPQWQNLVSIKPGRMTGDWRDSEEGIGRGRFSYNVNGILVPASLEAADRLYRSGLLAPYLSRKDRAELAKAGAISRVWQQRARSLFRTTIPAAEAGRQVGDYAAKIGVPAEPAQAALANGPLRFNAISLDDRGRPVPILGSDDGFLMLFGRPSAVELDTLVGAAMRPFPAGLMTDAGLLVANAAQAAPDVEDRFGPQAYHGAVIWSWQQALFAAGLERQLARKDLPGKTRSILTNAQASLWRTILAARATANSELWSWRYRNGRYEVEAFGVGKQDADESNAAQLWSTVYLAVRPPATLNPPR